MYCGSSSDEHCVYSISSPDTETMLKMPHVVRAIVLASDLRSVFFWNMNFAERLSRFEFERENFDPL